MSTMTLVVLGVVIVLIVGAIIGTRSTIRSESCCNDDKNCQCAETKHCSIKRKQ